MVHYKTYHRGMVTRFTNLPQETEVEGNGDDGNFTCGLPHAEDLGGNRTDGPASTLLLWSIWNACTC